ncbi:Thiosulfate sulfurtransferase/rhodanese-like domain-containing protein isoform 2 [Schistosoma japonicum]|uniref:Heat shock protein 67B2 n=1 Tax=Schistosoma japonicum TaxID=6182 RepID=C1L7V3_SCHJA|nr:Thiosulfate sulfurtransferase/rhodanese-like domain-containing protein isoform 2 [Schistosoma japonicum]CAX70781.1 Heat shock protein 67B2 [Schistosoma japonicum]CAX75854.1 Heat shock protein 67B2 [Schistosoma japonicum]CAX75855.1 Heat shock protein 67B2 [Schistosoma japonicum]
MLSVVRLTSFSAFILPRAFSYKCLRAKHHTLCLLRVPHYGISISRELSQKVERVATEGTKTHIDEARTKFVVTYDELHSKVSEKSVQLFDVRNGNDVESTGSIPGSVNIPLVDLKKALTLSDGEFLQKYGVPKPKMSDSNIIFYGLSDVSAASACEIAHNLGFKRAKYYLKGWTEWSSMPKEP